jgi:hypothetical protein
MVDDNEALVPVVEVPQPEGMAKLTITYGGQQGDLPDHVSFESTDADLKQGATEAVRAGDVPGIDAHPDADFADFVIDRFRRNEAVPFNRLSLRPKTPFGLDWKKWWSEYLTPLIGGEITEVGTKTDHGAGEHWPFLKVRPKEGEEILLEVSRDEEGNGPGFLFGLPRPQ